MEAIAQRLAAVLESERLVVAVSGGVDSLTLGAFAHRRRPRVAMVHAVSPAVPEEATRRTQALAREQGWDLALLDAGEFDDDRYRANPVNRCFHCKSALYGAIAARGGTAQVVSGTNLDDLGEYRPGLQAAGEFGVRHPFVEAGIDKATVRALARWLGLGEIAELPAAPCLSSRIETGIRIDGQQLAAVHAAEQLVRARLQPRTVRCRVRAHGVVLELDESTLDALGDDEGARLRDAVAQVMGAAGPVTLAPYRNGSAFLRQAT